MAATGNNMNVYDDLSLSQLPEGNWQETEETYVEMSGGLIDTLQNADNLKRSMEHSAKPMERSNLTDGYVDINTLTRKRNEEAMKSSGKKTSLKMCTMVFLAITMSVVISIAVSVATQILIDYVFHDNQPSYDHLTKFNCSSWIAARCTLNYTNSDTYECLTEAVWIEDKDLIAVGIQCVQISTYELSLPMATTLIIAEESNEAKCSCIVNNNSNKNSTLYCGIWISNCSPNNIRS